MTSIKCECHSYIKFGIKHTAVCTNCKLKNKIYHWTAKKTKKGKHYARHYQWMLNRRLSDE